MIEAKVPADYLRHVYDITSKFYGLSAAVFDRKARRLALERAEILPRHRVLEVGSGPGISLREIARRVDSTSLAVGVDISARMLDIAHRRFRASGSARGSLIQADGSRLPFLGASFDVVFSAYLLDLMLLDDIRAALLEFHRVLRPGGRLVLVSMTKKDEASGSWWEWVYLRLPRGAAAWLLGGCRPVMLARPVAEAGFGDVRRELVRQFVPSEIVIASKPCR